MFSDRRMVVSNASAYLWLRITLPIVKLTSDGIDVDVARASILRLAKVLCGRQMNLAVPRFCRCTTPSLDDLHLCFDQGSSPPHLVILQSCELFGLSLRLTWSDAYNPAYHGSYISAPIWQQRVICQRHEREPVACQKIPRREAVSRCVC